eukprot:scaffold6880_cov110-Isochrysis_galbana.AAC.20
MSSGMHMRKSCRGLRATRSDKGRASTYRDARHARHFDFIVPSHASVEKAACSWRALVLGGPVTPAFGDSVAAGVMVHTTHGSILILEASLQPHEHGSTGGRV